MAEWWLGARLAQIRRRRGVPQDELADKVGLSQNYISKLERGERDGLTVVTLCELADALDMVIKIVDKAGEGKAEDDSVKEQDRKLILPLRRLLLPITHVGGSLDETELTHAKLRKRVMESTADFNHARYAKLASEIPTLVISIEAAIGLHEGEVKENLYRLLAHTHILTAQTLIMLRSEDLATHAIRNAIGAAENAGDPTLRAAAADCYAWAFTEQGLFDDAVTVAVDMATEIEPSMTKATPEHLAAWGRLFLEASDAAARNNRPDTADELLSLAHSAAVRINSAKIDYGKFWATLNPSMIGIRKAQNAALAGDGELALHIGSGVQRTENLHLDWWTRHLRNRANAQTSTRDYAGAIETMKSIRRLAPEWIKNDRDAHDVVLRLLDAVPSVRRTRSSGLAELAQFMGVEP